MKQQGGQNWTPITPPEGSIFHAETHAVFAGALTGSRSANPAFGEVLDKAGNSVPTTSFAITYALANVFLTLLGPLIVAFV